MKKPYKTWGILALLDTISQNSLQNDQKTIGIFTNGDMDIRRAGKHYKTCRNGEFWGARGRPIDPLWYHRWDFLRISIFRN